MPKPVLVEIRKFPKASGELWPYLVLDGFPLIIPNLWIDELGLSARPNTLESYLRDIALIYKWGAENNVSIEDRLERLKGFSSFETRVIAQELCTTRNGDPASSSTCTRRLAAIRSFLEFGFEYFIELKRTTLLEQAQAEKNKNKQIRRLTKQILFASNATRYPTPSTDLTDQELEVIETIIHPESASNPFRSPQIKLRNYCIFHVLLETLSRRGELVLIEVSDIEFGSKPTIRIKEPSIVNKNRRRDGASLKFRGRTVPISSKLAELLERYIEEVRDDFLYPRRPSTALFLSKADGRRLSSHTINQLLKKLSQLPEVVALKKRIHPHGLRATAANIARKKITKAGRSSGLEIQEAISYLGGWAQDSPMVQQYTRSTISERLGELLRNDGTLQLKRD